jgi:DNA-binding HxlR family transcriptional regulator
MARMKRAMTSWWGRSSGQLGRNIVRWSELNKEACSVARTVSVVGDRWTLLILRDCFLRVRRFDDFQARLGVTRHVLANRLRKLTKTGVLERVAYQESPPRYEYRLTAKGLDLHPLIMSLVRWGDAHMAGRRGPPMLYRHRACGCDFVARLSCSECGETLDPRGVEVREGPGTPRGSHAHSALPPRDPGGKMRRARTA